MAALAVLATVTAQICDEGDDPEPVIEAAPVLTAGCVVPYRGVVAFYFMTYFQPFWCIVFLLSLW